MKLIFVLSAFLFGTSSALLAALPNPTVWEVRGGSGADTNGGCFVAGSSGTDYTQQAAAQFSGSDLATTTTASVVSSASYSFAATDVGNCLNISSGTGFTAGFYQIKSVSSGLATLDRAPAAASTTGGVWAEGGALASPGVATSAATDGNVVWVQGAATYSITAAVSLVTSFGSENLTLPNTRLRGYKTTRGDSGRATFQATAASINVLSVAGGSWNVSNLIIDCGSQSSDVGVAVGGGGNSLQFRNSTVRNCPSGGINAAGSGPIIENTEITANGGYGIQTGTNSLNTRIMYNWIHDNTGPGVVLGASASVEFNVISNNAGASSDGIQLASTYQSILYNTIYGNGRNGITRTTNIYSGTAIKGNLLASNAGYGFVGATGPGAPADYDWDGNAYWNNASGTRSDADDITVNPQDASGPYSNTQDLILTANPFNNSSGNDFSLNTTAGGGAAATGTAQPGAIPNLPAAGHMSFGALQPLTASATCTFATTGKAFIQ